MEQYKNSCHGKVHVIRQGDTLYQLSRQYDVKLFDIMRLNPYVNVYNLQIGDEICIPVAGKEASDKTYWTHKGDTLEDLKKLFSVSPEDLVRANPSLGSLALPENMEIHIPEI